MREENEEMDELQDEGVSLSRHLNSMKGVMQMINRQPAAIKVEEIKDPKPAKDDTVILSQQSAINPIEDPLSDPNTPAHT